jgi:hypothetical protein
LKGENFGDANMWYLSMCQAFKFFMKGAVEIKFVYLNTHVFLYIYDNGHCFYTIECC